MRRSSFTNAGVRHSSPRCAVAWCWQDTAPYADQREPKRTSTGRFQRARVLLHAAIAALKKPWFGRRPPAAMHRRTDLDELEFAALCAQLTYKRTGVEPRK